MRARVVVLSRVGWLVGLLCSATNGEVPAETGHLFGRWPTVSAVIHDEDQKNLDPGGDDFLIEVWFRPLPTLRYKGSDTTNVLLCKKAAERLPGYMLAYQGGRVSLTLCGAATELEKDVEVAAEAGLSTNAWSYVAAACSWREQTVSLFANGRLVKQWRDVAPGVVSNRLPLHIAAGEHGNTPAHCRIREVRVWKFGAGLPAGLEAVIAGHHAEPGRLADGLTNAAAYSRWVFTAGNDDVPDRGNNGNTLCLVPWGYKGPVALRPFPATPTGTTRYVDSRHPRARDDGPGTREEPFRSIAAGLKATYPGDVLHLCAGLYREAVYPRAGENGRPVTIEGEEGTVLTGSEPVTGWVAHAGDVWVVSNWTGKYEPPMDPQEADARSEPGNRLFVDDEPMDFVKTRGELVPGTWTVEPMPGRGPKTIWLYPPPGVDPGRVPVEITGWGGVTANGFSHLRNLQVTRCGVNLRGRRNVMENCTVSWAPFVCLSIGGQDQIVRNNRLLWGANSGVGGTSARLLFENNRLSYNGWAEYNGGWHGGAIKLIPANTDHVMRNNEVCYNDLAAIWYDAWNEGNLIEGNVCHDNSGHGGIFEEISFGNTLRYNLCYNNYGNGIVVAETSEDVLYRNIIFNNYGAGIFFRSGGPRPENPPAAAAALWEEFSEKLDVRRYQGLVTMAREQTLRDRVRKYWCRYDARSPGKLNAVLENVVFDNCGWGGLQVNQLVPYAKGVPVDSNVINRYAGNVYWHRTNTVIFSNGAHCTRDLDFKTWQELSGQDRDSRFLNPWENMDQMPAWFRQRFRFRSDEFRSIAEVADGYLANLRKSTARTVLMSRLLRSRTLERLVFTDPMLFGVAFEMDGQRCVSLWSKGVAVRDFLVPGCSQVTYESKYLKRTPVPVQAGQIRVLVGEAPVTLIGIAQPIKEDRSVVLTVPMWNEPGKPVTARVVLENAADVPRDYDLAVTVGEEGWSVANGGRIRQRVDAGAVAALDVALTPPAGARQGMFQVRVAGRAGDRDVALARSFGMGSLLAIKPTARHFKVDGDLSDWELGAPNGVADTRAQVVSGVQNWQGPEDLSARVWLRWHEARELYVAIEVQDDRLVVPHGAAELSGADSVQIMVDVRPEWKHYLKDYTPGAFVLRVTPGDATTPATATYERLRVGSLRGVASRKTAKGYVIELDIHFHTGEVEEPGWVAQRALRLGLLVHDADGQGRKATIGVWRTAADAAENCASLTPFVTEPPP